MSSLPHIAKTQIAKFPEVTALVVTDDAGSLLESSGDIDGEALGAVHVVTMQALTRCGNALGLGSLQRVTVTGAAAYVLDRDLRARCSRDLRRPDQAHRSVREEARDCAEALKESAMLEPILQGLREVDGVQGAMIVDHTAAVVAHRAHAIYDLAVLQQVARSVVNAADSVQLIQDDWDMLTAHFGEGKLLLRSLRTTAARPRRYILAVIADAHAQRRVPRRRAAGRRRAS